MKNFILIALALTFAAGALGGLFVLKKYQEREARLERYRQEAQKQAEEFTVTFPEGTTLDVTANQLEKKTSYAKTAFLNALKLSKPPITNPKASFEGMLFPDTYKFAKPLDPSDVISKMTANFQKKFMTASRNAIQTAKGYAFSEYGLELNAYELLTLASIVEKETGRDLSALGDNSKDRLLEERRTVAGIFLNRLKAGQALQSDATINYITGKSEAASSLDDTKINSPYNTYMFPGLTPTPICNPSAMSLEAVFSPIKTDYFYFLHKQPSGEVVYGKTYEDHLRNKQKYLK